MSNPTFFEHKNPTLQKGGMMGRGLCNGITSLNLLPDLDKFEKAEKHHATKHMEWFCAPGSMVPSCGYTLNFYDFFLR